MSDIQERLTKDIATIDWRDVLPHAKRDVVIVVDAALDLVAVGEAIAQDNTSLVSRWIQQKQIAKPSANQLSQWNNNPEKQFITLIVQPFVIVQESSS
ncbi:MAG: DUF2288 domain-containing protein [Xenococcaceae cyanobacterium MO_207.B15]|nr:DUF2288 domain-containing protein [Xenococcaceae cyanobacterium MO_207.B15]MDJ0745646.1 DUF2288 domain-containing protein [Xenococcaceae cyanobacterium MO_167.B27]